MPPPPKLILFGNCRKLSTERTKNVRTMWELRAKYNQFTQKSLLTVTTKFFKNANTVCQITRN